MIAPSTTTTGNWTAVRGNNAFNDATTYFHIDQNQRYMQSLGFTGTTGIQYGSIAADSNGANGDDTLDADLLQGRRMGTAEFRPHVGCLSGQ